MKQFNRDEFNADISSKLDDIRTNYLEESDPDSKAFVYAVADMFESLDEECFTYTDGASDKGVDFVIQDGSTFKFYQCKSVESLSDTTGKVFDAGPVNELAEAIDYLLDQGSITASKEVSSFKSLYQLNPSENSLTAVLAIEGSLSESAWERFQQIKQKYLESGISIELIDEVSIYNHWHDLEDLVKPSDVNLDLRLIGGDAILKQNGWIYGVFHLGPFIDAMEKYGNGLFDLNVRSNLRRSSVNDEIKRTISTAKGQKKFIHLNNGLVILCSSYSHQDGDVKIKLKGAQVVNGCQTLSTIWKYYLDANADQKAEIKENLKLFAKVINHSTAGSDGLLDEIIIASNNQNAMNARNLKSNTQEQRELQRNFWSSPLRPELRYFYIRKDGEFDSYLESGKRHPKKSEFLIKGTHRQGANKYRHVDNEKIAQTWWAWIGNSARANAGSLKYFEGSLYGNVFEKRPSEELLEAMALPNYSFSSDLLIAGSPSQYQLLLAMAVNSYLSVRARPKNGVRKFKQERIEELQAQGKISKSASSQEKAMALSNDSKYLYPIWKNQMTLALTEVASFILTRRYGKLSADTCRRIIDIADVSAWLTIGMDPSRIDCEEMTDDGALLALLWAFIDKALDSFFATNKSAILVENRPKLYLSKAENIVFIKESCIEVSENYAEIPLPGKPMGMTFFDALPDLG